eukprot:m.13497 g.13497  ORF g.13497 m.13497 type:complete len:363 (-) comp8443_c0_seq1:100-1188(-)
MPTELHTSTSRTIEALLLILGYFLDHQDDYWLDITEVRFWNRHVQDQDQKITLSLWCMNPAVAFEPLASQSRAIVLTSGTLSPLETFASELGTEFPIRLEANHVIKPTQAWVGSLSRSLNGSRRIMATYKFVQTLDFQDDVGEFVLNCCKIVPGGVLVFVTSYSLLSKLFDRWSQNGVLNEISTIKQVVQEPRGSDKAELDAVMQLFYSAIHEAQHDPSTPLTGALMFAVCRGKISEGIDFSDDNARAVISIGIPYPSFVDPQVKLKREYNDKHCRSRPLLNGSKWYDIQAFRALNQGLGRCLRHKDDWGALILIDARFSENERYVKSLSKWVRGMMKHYSSREVLTSLSDFVKVQKENQAT